MRVLYVVPALNEEEALPGVVGELRAAHPDAEILVVDDGSTDGTARVAAAAGARVVRLARNLGIGAAVQCGLRVALREGFDCAVQCDGDGQHPPVEAAKLIAAWRASPAPDLVIGHRYHEASTFRSTPLRRLGSWWLARVLGVLGARVKDPTSGYRLYGTRALALFAATYPYDYPEPEALAMATRRGLRVAEVPVLMRPRQGGTSSIAGLLAPYYMLKVTMAILLAFVRTRKGTAE